jgi:hypothetical protein
MLNNYVFERRWDHSHHGMARSGVADGGDGLQLWRVEANVLNEQWRRADKWCCG